MRLKIRCVEYGVNFFFFLPLRPTKQALSLVSPGPVLLRPHALHHVTSLSEFHLPHPSPSLCHQRRGTSLSSASTPRTTQSPSPRLALPTRGASAAASSRPPTCARGRCSSCPPSTPRRTHRREVPTSTISTRTGMPPSSWAAARPSPSRRS
jgi:hypothetical protein